MSLFCCPTCGLPAEDIWHFVVQSSDGPIEYYHARCIQEHLFTLPADEVAERIEVEALGAEAAPPVSETQPVNQPAGSSAGAGPGAGTEPAPAARSGSDPGEAAFGLAHLPPPHTTVDTLWAPRTRLAAGAFFAGGLSSGFLLRVPVVVAFAIVLGLMAVAVIASLVPMALTSRRLGRGKVASFGRHSTGAADSSGTNRRAA